ncbi:MAG: LETM1-related biofilm-associated protein [Brumimicrobium sp.]|nr:LETM1-related biofilm-associated protein [Brumimicrobium sp.]
MLQPGAKNWIEKYFELVRGGVVDLSFEFPEEIGKEEFLHTALFQSGLTFGVVSDFIFCGNLETRKWTADEKLKVLLFEGLILTYLSEHDSFDEQEFEKCLIEFYKQYQEQRSFNVFQILVKETPRAKMEHILKQRLHIPKTLTNQLWVNYLYNSLVFLDILAFRQFLKNGRTLEETHVQFAMGVLNTVGLASLIDGVIEPAEQNILDVFLSSSSIDDKKKREFRRRIDQKDLSISSITLPDENDILYKYYLVDVATLTVHSDLSAMDTEIVFLYELCNYLKLDTEALHNAIILIEAFIIENGKKINFLKEQNSYDRLYGNFSKRWIKILGRNKDKFVEELRESKELIALVNKSLKEELTPEEKEKVKNQFKDLVKSMPALAIFMLPGGMILLPIIMKIVPDLLPSAFKGNEPEDDSDTKKPV